jgi:hypothetical protein
MKLVFIFVVFSFVFPVLSQDEDYEVRIRHYQRKVTLDYLPLPNSILKPADFKIIFPDTMYNQAYIEVKKYKLEGPNRIFKNAYMIIVSENKEIKQLNLAISNKSEFKLEQYLTDNFGFSLDEENDYLFLTNNDKRIIVKKQVLKRQLNYEFSFE